MPNLNTTINTMLKGVGKAIVPAVALLLVGGFVGGTSAFAQETAITVEGTVTDSASGKTLPGVNVSVVGTSRGTATNAQGEYTLEAPSPQDELRFTFVGYEPEVVPIEGRSEINVALSSSVLQQEGVVKVAFGEQKEVSVTSSISSVQTEELLKAPTANVANALVGKVTGLQSIQSGGRPGRDAAEIYIRGASSINRNRSAPLIVIDGVNRSYSAFVQLDANNIKSISILKDAAATAPYGIRGANGVILVETKRGKAGERKINVSLSAGTQRPLKLPELAGAYTWARMRNQAQINDGTEPSFSDEALNAWQTGSQPVLYPNVNWMDYLLNKNALQTKNNINISGGTEDVQYFVAGGFTKQQGLMNMDSQRFDSNYGMNRYNFRANLDADVTPTTTVQLTSGGRLQHEQAPQYTQNRSLLSRIYRTTPISGSIVDGKVVTLGSEASGRFGGFSPSTRYGINRFFGQGFRNYNSTTINLDLSVKQKLDFLTKGLKFKVKGAYNNYYQQNKSRSSSVARYTPYYRTEVDPSVPGDSSVVFRKSGSEGDLSYNEWYNRDRDWYAEAKLSYNRTFDEKHDVTLMGLYNQERDYYLGSFSSIPRSYVNMVGRVNYGYDSRYFVDFNMSFNGSENFREGRRFGFFPAVSAGWVVSNESFMEDVSFIDRLKLRGSYGLVGNDRGVGRFLYLPDRYLPACSNSGYREGWGYNFGVNWQGYRTIACEGQIGNPDVKWETAQKQNYGLDLTLLDHKLEFTFDYFREHRVDILTTQNTIPAYVASDLPAVNIGEVKNRGFEAEMTWRQQLGDDFNYRINPRVSYAHNTVLEIDEPTPPEPYMARTGESVGQQFGFVFDRFYTQEDEEAEGSGSYAIPDHNTDLEPGDLIYKDLNDDGVINSNDRRDIGYPRYPEVTAGATLGLNYKGFSLTTIWQGATRTSRFLTGPFREIYQGGSFNKTLMKWMVDERWQPGDGQNAGYPRFSMQNNPNNSRKSTFYMRDASYIRLKNIEIGYTFESDFLNSYLGFDSMRIYANGYNVLTFAHMDVVDPEMRTSQQRAQNNGYPLMKVYNAGVDFTF